MWAFKADSFHGRSLLDYMAEHYDAVIIESFGVGGLPSYDGGDYHRAWDAGPAWEKR